MEEMQEECQIPPALTSLFSEGGLCQPLALSKLSTSVSRPFDHIAEAGCELQMESGMHKGEGFSRIRQRFQQLTMFGDSIPRVALRVSTTG